MFGDVSFQIVPQCFSGAYKYHPFSSLILFIWVFISFDYFGKYLLILVIFLIILMIFHIVLLVSSIFIYNFFSSIAFGLDLSLFNVS